MYNYKRCYYILLIMRFYSKGTSAEHYPLTLSKSFSFMLLLSFCVRPIRSLLQIWALSLLKKKKKKAKVLPKTFIISMDWGNLSQAFARVFTFFGLIHKGRWFTWKDNCFRSGYRKKIGWRLTFWCRKKKML